MIDIDKLEDLPYRASFKKHEARVWWDYGWYRGRQYGGKYSWEIVERILKKYKGKQVNKAFSEYCKIVDINDQHRFWEEFDRIEKARQRRGADYKSDYWFIDKNNNIQFYKLKKEPKTYHIRSADYEEGYVDHMGNVITVAEYYKIDGYSYLGTRWTKAKTQKWKLVIIKGCEYTFNKKDADFYRCLADENGKLDRMYREYEKYAEKKVYSFLTREEEQKTKDKNDDIIKRDAHGFDENSFTNNNGRLNKA